MVTWGRSGLIAQNSSTLKSVLSTRWLGIKAKKCLYEGVIVPTAIYRAEACCMRSAESQLKDKNLHHKLPCSSWPYFQSRTNRECGFCPANMLTFSKYRATYILVRINYLTISMYTHYKTKCLLIIELVYVSLMSKPCKWTFYCLN